MAELRRPHAIKTASPEELFEDMAQAHEPLPPKVAHSGLSVALTDEELEQLLRGK